MELDGLPLYLRSFIQQKIRHITNDTILQKDSSTAS